MKRRTLLAAALAAPAVLPAAASMPALALPPSDEDLSIEVLDGMVGLGMSINEHSDLVWRDGIDVINEQIPKLMVAHIATIAGVRRDQVTMVRIPVVDNNRIDPLPSQGYFFAYYAADEVMDQEAQLRWFSHANIVSEERPDYWSIAMTANRFMGPKSKSKAVAGNFMEFDTLFGAWSYQIDEWVRKRK